MTDTKTGTLREAIEGALFRSGASHYDLAPELILALPELAAVIADADNWRRATTGDPTEPEPLAMQARELLVRNRELEATVARVRELRKEIDAITNTSWSPDLYDVGVRLDRALDGEPQP